MHVLVTGGAGFIGANLVRRLAGGTVATRLTVVDDLSTGKLSRVDGLDRTRVLVGSVLDESLLDEAMEGVDSVVHLAAVPSVPRSVVDPVTTHEANATGTLRVVEAVRRCPSQPHVVVASSSSVYGGVRADLKHEGLPTTPTSPYGASKLAAESYALAYQAVYHLPVLVLRFFNVFGPLQSAGHAYAAAIPTFVDAALRGRPLQVHGDGRQSRDFTAVDDVTGILTDAVARRVTHAGPVNLAFGTRRTLLEVIEELGRLVDGELEVERRAARPGDIRHSQADGTLLRRLFPDALPTDFRESLSDTVEWYRGQVVEQLPVVGRDG